MKVKNFETDTIYVDTTFNEKGVTILVKANVGDDDWPTLDKAHFSWLEVASFSSGDRSLTAHLMSCAALLLQSEVDSTADAEEEDEDEE